MSGRRLISVKLRARGFRALGKETGYAHAVRFLRRYEPGCGGHAEKRRSSLAERTIDEITHASVALLERGRRESGSGRAAGT